jgi:cell division septation protein DedD/nucleoid DNA-binding protein
MALENNLEISTLVSELLHHYDCVIVPELGGFVTDYRSARIDKELHIIHPPSKDLRFNAQLNKSDGLLANALSQAKAISHEEANTRIKDEVDAYFSALDKGKTVRFEKVGILYLDSHKNLQFRVDESVNYLLDSFRLKKVYAEPMHEIAEIQVPTPAINVAETIKPAAEEKLIVHSAEPAEEKETIVAEKVVANAAPEPTEESAPIVPISESSSGRRWMAAALIPLLIYLGLVAVRSDVVHDGDIQMSDLNPFKKVADSGRYTPRTGDFNLSLESLPEVTNISDVATSASETPIEETNWDELAKEIDARASTAESYESEVVPAAAINTYVAPLEISGLEFHVIGGCFGEVDNAERLVDRLRQKGYDAYIMDFHKGLHRVTYGNYSTRAKALKDLNAIKQGEQSEAWLLRKK